jgi:hypothetical protein
LAKNSLAEVKMKHRDQVLGLLQKQIGNAEEVRDISKTADEVASKWVNPLSGGKEETNGLIYGLVQSGKTGVLTATGALKLASILSIFSVDVLTLRKRLIQRSNFMGNFKESLGFFYVET